MQLRMNEKTKKCRKQSQSACCLGEEDLGDARVRAAIRKCCQDRPARQERAGGPCHRVTLTAWFRPQLG